MVTPSFSRLQLAAALIEYDNDNEESESPIRSARESAIFTHTRRPPNRPPIASLYMQPESRPSMDFLGVKLPSEGDAASQFERGRRASSVMDPELDQRQKEEKVDLDSWGMGALNGEKGGREDEDDDEDDTFHEPERRRAVSEFLPNPHSPVDDTFQRPNRISFARTEIVPPLAPRPSQARRASLGDFGAGGAFLDSPRSSAMGLEATSSRRASLDLDRATARYQEPGDAGSSAPVPFPTAETPGDQLTNPFALRPPSPGRSSRFDPKSQDYEGRDRARTMSRASMGSRFYFDGGGDDRRSMASGMVLDDGRSMTGASMYYDADDGRSRRMSRMSYMEDDMRSRRMSRVEGEGLPRAISRLEILRPKVLVMPNPLQGDGPMSTPEPETDRPGFLVSKDGPPLPPGAKTERPGPRPLSTMGMSQSYQDPSPSNPFLPNPRQSLTLSQLTFRNTLMKDASLADIGLKKAAAEGEKVTQEVLEEEEEEPVVKGPPERAPGRLYGTSLIDSLEERKAMLRSKKRVFTGDNRPSMMDRPQLNRSSTLIDPASFDKRASVISRRPTGLGEIGRQSSAPLLQFEAEDTLKSPIDPGPDFRRMTKTKSTFGVDQIWERELAKLQTIEAEEKRLAEEERRKEEEREAKKARKLAKGKARAPLEPTSPQSQRAGSMTGKALQPSPANVPSLPVLPASSFLDESHRRESVMSLGTKNWFGNDSDDEEGTSDSGAELITPRKPKAYSKSISPSVKTSDTTPTKARETTPRASMVRDDDDDDDDEDLPLAARLQKMKVTGIAIPEADSEEEDVPLAAVLTRRLQGSASSKHNSSPRATQGTSPKPASFTSPPGKPASFTSPSGKPASFTSPKSALPLPTFDFDTDKGGLAESLGLDFTSPSDPPSKPPVTSRAPQDSDDDDVPLGVRHPGVVIQPPIGGDEDEAPLGMRFPTAAMAQQQQAQALQQQQYMMMMQQQLMWQAEAQIRNSVAFPTAPSMMGMPSMPTTPFGMPQPGMPFVPAGPQMPVPPALTDPGKYNRVDQWRREVGADD